MTSTFNFWWVNVHMQKIVVKEKLVQKIERQQTDGKTDTTGRIIFPLTTVSKWKSTERWGGSVMLVSHCQYGFYGQVTV